MRESVCKLTGAKFEISDCEQEAFRSFDLPLPIHSPEERLRRYLAFRNDRNFFWRSCNQSGQRVYSSYPASTLFPVVSPEIYYSTDEKNSLSYGREFDFNRPFFEQLHELWQAVPRPATSTWKSKNSHAVSNVQGAHGSYLVIDAQDISNCMYSVGLRRCEFCIDCSWVSCSAHCYECIDCHNCSYLCWSLHSRNCSHSRFLRNCTDCQHCLFCEGLEGKSYHVFNKPLSPEEYADFEKRFRFTDQRSLESAQQEFADFLAQRGNGKVTEGDNGQESSTAPYSEFCEDVDCVVRCRWLTNAEHCLEGCGSSGGLRRAAQFVSVGRNSEELINCVQCYNVSKAMYCFHCEDSSHLFACIGLRNREYCIFNVQYSKDEYQRLLSSLWDYLKSKSIWGLFFPPMFSEYSYNRSSAGDHMPLNEIQAAVLRYTWDKSDDLVKPSQLMEYCASNPEEGFSEVPESTEGLVDDALSKLYLCSLSGKPFQLTRQEVSLYEMLSVPPPEFSFEERQKNRTRLIRKAVRA